MCVSHSRVLIKRDQKASVIRTPLLTMAPCDPFRPHLPFSSKSQTKNAPTPVANGSAPLTRERASHGSASLEIRSSRFKSQEGTRNLHFRVAAESALYPKCCVEDNQKTGAWLPQKETDSLTCFFNKLVAAYPRKILSPDPNVVCCRGQVEGH